MTSASHMRLDRFPTLRASSFDELAGLLSAKGMVAERVSPGDTARMNTVYRAGWYLAHLEYDMALRIGAGPDRDDYTLYLPVAGAVRATDGRDSVDCSAARTVLASPARPLVTWTSAQASRITLTIKRDLLMRHLIALLGDDGARLPVFSLSLDLTRPAVRAYLRHLWGVVEAVDEDPEFLDRPLVGPAVEQSLIGGLLQVQQHELSARMERTGAAPAPADVKRAVDYIDAHLAEDVTLADLARVAGVPGRTLQTHFRDRFGCGPMQYLRERRLCRARRELLRGGPAASVTEIALRWGFGGLSRFAATYRARFGESPSVTLRTGKS